MIIILPTNYTNDVDDSGQSPESYAQYPVSKDLPHKNTEFGQVEKELGVGVNRRLIKDGTLAPTQILFYGGGGVVEIDIENDPKLADWLRKYQKSLTFLKDQDPEKYKDPRNLAQLITTLAAIDSSEIDFDHSQHPLERHSKLGDVLSGPITCSDRALVFEATLKMNGFSDADQFTCRDNKEGKFVSLHNDVIFTINNTKCVAITMGSPVAEQGSVFTVEEYEKNHLPKRKELGLGERIPDYSWGESYFESIKTS